jgi:CheY-like chemotaxis protein
MALIVIVDDERPIRELLSAFLDDLGHRTVVAANGGEALEVVAQQVPALVITDLMMPVLDGAELVRQLKANPATADVPIVVGSAIYDRTIPSGVAAFTPKPYDLDQLESLVGQLLGER